MSAPAVDVLAVLRATRCEAQRNAAVLDHISTPTTTLPLSNPPQPSNTSAQKEPTSSQPLSDPACENNTTPKTASQEVSPSSAPRPISKYILSSLFEALDLPHPKQNSSKHANYCFLDNDQENHFLYGLVLPVIARLLAVSCPGLLCIVQLPRPDKLPEWSIPSSTLDGYGSNGSNGSNGSKSGAHTTLSPQGTTSTPSPSGEVDIAGPRNSISPEANPGTAELMRRADKILSGREAAAVKRADDSNARENGSPPPDAVVQDHGALRLICNGFEVLTGKMPRPKSNMGSFTLATVGWEKAGIVSPEHSSKGICMSFSNGMMTPTEGLIATFSNGSMCFLTLRDSMAVLESMKITESTPVIAFTFACVGQQSVGDILAQDPASLSPEASRVRKCVEKPNVFVMEIGHSGSGVSQAVSLVTNMGDNQQIAEQEFPQVSNGNHDRKEKDKQKYEKSTVPRCPPVVLGTVPRAVPLFVNTINRTFIDPPYYEVPENAYENELINDRYVGLRTEHPSGNDSFDDDRRENREQSDLNPADKLPSDPKKSADGLPEGNQERLPSLNSSPEKNVSNTLPPISGTQPSSSLAPQQQSVPCPSSHPRHTAGHMASSQTLLHAPRHPSAYGYYGYRSGHLYPANSAQAGPGPPSMPTHPVALQQSHSAMNGAHGGYYQPVQSARHTPNGHYHHHPGGGYPSPYYAVPHPQSMIHQTAQHDTHWHHGVPAVAHQPAPFPPPHHMDARRDMPAHFSSHRAIVSSIDGRYQSEYYARPSRTGHVAHQHDSHVFPGTRLQHESHPEMNKEAIQARKQGADNVENNNGVSRFASGSPQSGNELCAPQAGVTKASDQRPKAERAQRDSYSQDESHVRDKEHVLRALIQMRNGRQNGRETQREKRPRSPEYVEMQQDLGGGSNWSSEKQLSPNKKDEPIGKSEAYEMGEQPEGRLNGIRVGGQVRASTSRQGRSSNTNSSTSTNSQGGALMNGAVTGNSHSIDPDCSVSPPNQKRVRKR